jgi:hypothetical protein
MATYDLITNSRARVALPSAAGAGTSDDTAINTLITACSRAITRYCKRQFITMDYDELYSGRAEREIFLRNYPINSVKSVRYRPVTVLKVQNSKVNTPQARAQITSTALVLTSITSGVASTDATLTFAGNVTVLALQNAVNGVSGWTAQGQGYDQWPSVDLYCPNGSTTDPGNFGGQGSLNAAGTYAELKMHTYELAGFQIDNRKGGLLRAIPYTDPELLHPEDLIWPIGVNNFRIQYNAGYGTTGNVPEDIQEACAQLVAHHFRLGPRETPDVTIPAVIAQYLAPYKAHTLLSPGG